nr:MAG TPA: hypothetical protein [Caudoviricetes sp.]
MCLPHASQSLANSVQGINYARPLPVARHFKPRGIMSQQSLVDTRHTRYDFKRRIILGQTNEGRRPHFHVQPILASLDPRRNLLHVARMLGYGTAHFNKQLVVTPGSGNHHTMQALIIRHRSIILITPIHLNLNLFHIISLYYFSLCLAMQGMK